MPTRTLGLTGDNSQINVAFPGFVYWYRPVWIGFFGLGQELWFGHPGLLSALCYSVPIVATTLLVMAGMETWRTELAIAALAVASGAWMSGMSTKGTWSNT
jgi:hypothetical protein